jgi:hypothetical protein
MILGVGDKHYSYDEPGIEMEWRVHLPVINYVSGYCWRNTQKNNAFHRGVSRFNKNFASVKFFIADTCVVEDIIRNATGGLALWWKRHWDTSWYEKNGKT